MRVVFLANPVHDYLQDAVFHGLVSILGPGNVVEYPPLERYHSPAPPDTPHPHLWFPFPEPPRASLDELVDWADGIVIGSLRSGVRAAVGEVLALHHRPPIALLDGEDEIFVLRAVSRVDLYFKREILASRAEGMQREALRRAHRLLRKPFENRDPLADPICVARSGDSRLIPLPLAWIGPPPERRPIEHDVAFLHAPTSSVRTVVRADLERLRAEGVRVRLLEEGERLRWREYMDVLCRSRIGISVRGGGYDTYRYWEVAAAGALLLAEPTRVVIPGNFVDGREAVFALPRHMPARLRTLLEGETDEIGAAGRGRLLAGHTSVHRARTVLDALSSHA
jgi:hypothetical protein